MHPIAKALLLPAIALLCSACTAPLTHDSTTPGTSEPQVTRLEAKYRLLLSAPGKDSGIRRFCAEPAPDVFFALAASLSLDASAQKTADEKAAALKLAKRFELLTSSASHYRTLRVGTLDSIQMEELLADSQQSLSTQGDATYFRIVEIS